MTIEIRILGRDDEVMFANIASGLFDKAVVEENVREFLGDGRHHIAVAIESGSVIGFVSAVHYIHPDKPTELWINEVAVAPNYQRQGVGRRILSAMLGEARRLGCHEAWVLTDRGNVAAMRLYSSLGGKDSDQVMFNFKLGDGNV